MKVDIGFWDINGNYIEDIQELNEIERKEIMETKNFNEFFDELNDMANFKNFGEKEKEIKIDGVDVAGCKDYDDGICCNDYVLTLSCEKTNCMYKQLKKLQQENEKFIKVTNDSIIEQEKQIAKINNLKQENAELKAYKDVNEDFKTAWEELKAENERLKTQYNCYACGNCNGKEDYINLEKHHKGLRKQFEKYYQQTLDDEIIINELYQTLQEIKAIVKENIAKNLGWRSELEYEILQKITKAEEE